MKRTVLVGAMLVAGAAVLAGLIPAESRIAAETTGPEAAAIAGLKWRSIGPANMGGRVADIAGIPGDPSTFYVVPANGGIFKTTNGGTTHRQIFGEQDIASVGAIAIAPSDPNVIWAGTGEGDPRNSASFGNGVYRSTDGGETWKHVGLADTERIKRIRVDPKDPDTAFVAALGHEWGPNEERGLFKTTDGGKTWMKVLYKDNDTGCSDVDIDPSNPRVLYAGMFTFRRLPWRFDSGGGQTALYKTTDGGATWKKLTEGLPKGPMDRVGVAVSHSNPDVVYMITETKDEGVLFRSEDRGESFKRVSDDPNLTFRPFYYSDIRVDPNDPQRVYALGGSLWMSRDGGRNFERIGSNVHGDHQALWIDPTNSNRVLSGSDGGFQVSYDGAKTFEIINNLAISQFYHINYDLRQPYYVCGGLQDNGNWCGPSATLSSEGIRKDDWYTVSGGDGFFAVPDPSAPNLVYSDSQGGVISITDTTSGNTRNIHPYPVRTGSAGDAIADHKYRFNWNSPIVLSPHDPKTVYFGGNVVFKTTSRGQSWDVISPDLTTNDKSKQQSSGGPIVTDNTAAEFHCTILTIAESPVRAGVLWVGTDDGNVQVTKDGGKSWTNVAGKIPELPANSWIPAIEASHFDAGTAYVAVDRHRNDDFGPYAFKTSDYGQTWTAIKSNLPAKGYVHVVREDLKNRNLLFAGTELGVFASWDGGGRWVSIRNGLPPLAVNDMQIHPRDNDLIIATHSQGVWILDDIAPLQQLRQALAAETFVFDVRPATRYQMWGRDANLGSKTFAAQNPPAGAYVNYYLKSEPKDAVLITIADESGAMIRELRDVPKAAGVNRAVWDLRYEAPAAAEAPDARGHGPGAPGAGRESEGPEGRFGARGGPLVVPGDYTIKVTAGGKEATKIVRVDLDPRLTVSQADLQAELDVLLALRDLTAKINVVVDRTDDMTRQLTSLAENLRRAGAATPTPSAQNAGHGGEEQQGGAGNTLVLVNAAIDRLKQFRTGQLVRPLPMGYRYYPRLKEEVGSLTGAIGGSTNPPTDAQKKRLQELEAETAKIAEELNGIIGTSIAEINARLAGTPHIVTSGTIK